MKGYRMSPSFPVSLLPGCHEGSKHRNATSKKVVLKNDKRITKAQQCLKNSCCYKVQTLGASEEMDHTPPTQ